MLELDSEVSGLGVKCIGRNTFLPVLCRIRGVTRLDGARGKKQVWSPVFETEVFRKQMYCIEESTCDVVGTFCRPPQPFGVPIASRRPGNCARRPPRYAPVPDSGDSGFSVFGQTRSDYTGDHCAAVTRALIFQK